MSQDEPRSAIRLGIDFGNTTCRVAYVHPGGKKAVVPVPLPLEKFRPCYPISEKLATNEMYVSRFFPGILQRLKHDFTLMLEGKPQLTRDITVELVRKAVSQAEQFAGRPVEGLLVSHTMCAGADARASLQQAVERNELDGAVSTDAETVCAYFGTSEMEPDEHATVLVFSAGYTGLGVAAARVTPRGVRVLAKAADERILGGNVLDFSILQSAMHCLKRARITFADDPTSPPWAAFQYAVEAAKHSVRDGNTGEFAVPKALTPTAGGEVKMALVGSVFRDLVGKHLDAAMDIVDTVLEDTQVAEEELGYVLLVGGTTHLPDVARRIQERFSRATVRHLPPESVAGGAALLASEDYGTDVDGEPSVMVGGEAFLPDLEEVPGLVELRGSSEEVGGVSRPADETRAREQAAAGVERVENPALAELRSKIDEGEFDGAYGELKALQESIRRRLDLLEL